MRRLVQPGAAFSVQREMRGGCESVRSSKHEAHRLLERDAVANVFLGAEIPTFARQPTYNGSIVSNYCVAGPWESAMTYEEFKRYYWREGGSKAHRHPVNRWFDWHDDYGNVRLRGHVAERASRGRYVVLFYDDDDYLVGEDVATTQQFYLARCRFYRTHEEMRDAG